MSRINKESENRTISGNEPSLGSVGEFLPLYIPRDRRWLLPLFTDNQGISLTTLKEKEEIIALTQKIYTPELVRESVGEMIEEIEDKQKDGISYGDARNIQELYIGHFGQLWEDLNEGEILRDVASTMVRIKLLGQFLDNGRKRKIYDLFLPIELQAIQAGVLGSYQRLTWSLLHSDRQARRDILRDLRRINELGDELQNIKFALPDLFPHNQNDFHDTTLIKTSNENNKSKKQVE